MPSSRTSWAAYGAALWALIFAVFHFIWAAGWYIGLDAEQARIAFAKTPFLVYDLVVAGMCTLAVPVALALAMPWGHRLPRRLFGLFAWGGTGLLVIRSAASIVQTVYLLGRGQFVIESRGLWELWFYVGATLFALATWRFWRHRSDGHSAGNREQHGFTRVDEEARPASWVEVLDRVHREPFYREYKERVRAILSPRPADLYLEVGSGVGTDAIVMGAKVVGVDRSLTMCRESRARGLMMSVVADAEALPFPSGIMDGCWSDRTFQHLAHPRRALDECIRVTKAGATIVVVDPDYGTQTMEFPDRSLAQKVLDFRAHHLLRNGTLAHQMKDLFFDARLDDVVVEEKQLTVRDPASLDNVLGLRSWARTALERGLMSDAEVHRWETLYDECVTEGRFLWSVSFFITRGRKPL
jgi:ubiquinone/menaquinone biosynthesis C-methylase UbiE